MLILNGIDPDWKVTLSQETTDYLLLYLSDKFKKELTEEQLQFTVFNSGHFRIIEKVNEKVNSSSWVLETPSVYWLEQGTKYYGGYAWSSFAPLTPDKHGIIYKAEKKEKAKMKNKEAFDLVNMARDINYGEDCPTFKALTLAMEALDIEMNREAWIQVCEEILEITFDEKQKAEYGTRIKILKSLRSDK